MFLYALSLPSVLMRFCSRDDTALSSVVIRPCPRDDKPLFSGGRVKGFPRSQEKLRRGAVKGLGWMLKSDDTDVGRWRWVEKGVSRFCHTPSALRARPPVSGGQSGCGRFFWLCPSKLGGRGAKRRRGYVSFPFLVFRLSYPSALWARPLVSSGQSGWPVSFIAAAVEIGLSPSTPPPACSSCATSRREVGRQG